ncbi:MAG: hypothetical protein PHY25_04635, partial [Dehalococcoidales bacterium]|nr:hypothetical protein [Dehalococcoidales bacterium]
MGNDQNETTSTINLTDKVIRYFKTRGFEITTGAVLKGKSGVNHTFSLLAQRDDGFTQQVIALLVLQDYPAEEIEEVVFDFANKAFDTD